MDNKMSENISYLEHQAQSASVAMKKIEKVSKVLRVTEKPERRVLTGDAVLSESNFMEI